jgi:proline dehydrogenase
MRILGNSITHASLRYSFFNHFCAGEDGNEIVPKMKELTQYGVGGILDYAAEAKEEDTPNVEPMPDSSVVGAPRSSRHYDYQGEAVCDANADIFLDAVRAVKNSTPNGFAAIKLSGLGNPQLLERMSTCLYEMTVFFQKMSGETASSATPLPYYCIDRSFKLDFASFHKGWNQFFKTTSEEEVWQKFDAIDQDGDGKIPYLEWSSSIQLSDINELVRSCQQEGPLFRAALNEEEMQLYFNLIARVRKIMDLAQELGVRVMVDAEWTDIQPAIDHIVQNLTRRYNYGDQPLVFNTYQTYLKGMSDSVASDLERSRREGWRFGAKVVRGAYMVSERKKAKERGLQSPICETYEDTEKEFNATVDAILAHTDKDPSSVPPLLTGQKDGPGRTAGAEVLIASHNRQSIERTLGKVDEFKFNRQNVYFGQLMGMADHLTFTLGANGYKAYKYVPYGPIGEVVPYLIRRTQENSAILGSEGVQEERRMVGKELRRRLFRI